MGTHPGHGTHAAYGGTPGTPLGTPVRNPGTPGTWEREPGSGEDGICHEFGRAIT